MVKSNYRYILTELKHHIPFTAISTIVSLILFEIVARIFLQGQMVYGQCPCCGPPNIAGSLFHVMHPLHMLFSAIATTAMFWRHEKKLIKAITIGLAGAIIICTISDIIFPHLGGLLMGRRPELHICILEHPETVIPAAVGGILIGLFAVNRIAGRRVTIVPHSAHVFVSIFATMFYLRSFVGVDFLNYPIQTFIIILLGVVIPCCISDIVFPLLVKKKRKKIWQD